jgi:hypothetical protein
MRLRPVILKMKPGTRVVSNSFDMGDWEPDDTADVSDDCRSYCRALYWVVPANAAGTWKLPEGELVLEQKHQMLSGTLRSGSDAVPIASGRMIGENISFTAGTMHYTGRMSGDGLQGMVRTETPWRATR